MPREREIPPTTLDELRRNLERLKLHPMLAGLDLALEQAATLEQGYVTFLAGLVGTEVLAQSERAAASRLKAANFEKVRTFDTFDWTFQSGLNIALVNALVNRLPSEIDRTVADGSSRGR